MGKIKKRWNIELVTEELKILGYYMEDKVFINSKTKITVYDSEGYYYSSILHKIFSRNILKFHKTNPYTIQNIKLWCKLNNKPFKILSEKYVNRKSKLNFKCLKDDCNEIFESTFNDILDSCGCPYCAGRQVGLSNCLATLRPDLASEWHITLNNELTPYDVTCGRNNDIWWQCKINQNHIWQSKIYNRCKGENCPFCYGRYPTEDYNLLINNPDLCENWNYKKNNKKPEEYCPNSGKSVYWKCKYCGYEWKAIIDNISKGRVCPRCSETKGEKEIDKTLSFNSVNYIFHKIFTGCKYKHVLEFDFYLQDYMVAIEYQGIQHYEPVDFAGRGQEWAENEFNLNQKRDKIKRDYCKNNNINLIEIPYWEFSKIKEILSKVLETQNKQKQLTNN